MRGMSFRPQFTIRTLLLVVAVTALWIRWWEITHPHGLCCTWKGSEQMSGYTFRFDGSQMHVSNHSGTVSTPYTTSSIGDMLTLDFDGANGHQRGIYRIDELHGTLTMLVADAGAKRPDDMEDTGGSNYVRYTLQRAD